MNHTDRLLLIKRTGRGDEQQWNRDEFSAHVTLSIMPLIRAGSLSKLAPGEMMEFIAGTRTIAICNAGGTLHAVDGSCPHRQGPLAQGALHGTAVVCPWHAWEFDCVSGEHDYNPSIKLETFRVEISGDDILVDIA